MSSVDPLTPGAVFDLGVAVGNEGLIVSAPLDANEGAHTLELTVEGCVSSQCGQRFKIRAPLQVVGLSAPAGPLAEFAAPSPDRRQDAVPLPAGIVGKSLQDELIITVGSEDAPGDRRIAEAAAAGVDGFVSGGVDELGVFQIRWTTPQDLDARKVALKGQPGVSDVSDSNIELVGEHALPPGDWNDDGHEAWWPFVQVRAPQAWDVAHAGATVGIVDAGTVKADHEDLNVIRKLGTSGAAPHATHVAGLACARANGIGLVGMAWGCPIVSAGMKGLAEIDTDVLLTAIAVEAEPGVRVINMSLGYNLKSGQCATAEERVGLQSLSENAAPWFRRLFKSLRGREIVWTLSAGNNCTDAPGSAWARSADLDNVITVASTNSEGSLSSFSNFGPTVEVAAPGGVDLLPPRNGTVGIWSACLYPSKYCTMSGTSMAAPIVAGLASILRARYPQDTASETGKCIVRWAGGDAGVATKQSAWPEHYKPENPFPETTRLPIVNAEDAVACRPGQFIAKLDATPSGLKIREPISVQLAVRGGAPPIKWALKSDSGIGLTLSPDGLLTGAPKAAGTWNYEVALTDANGETASVPLKLDVAYGDAAPIRGTVRRLTQGNAASRIYALSADGSTALVGSSATNLTNDSDSANTTDLFAIDTVTGDTTRITSGTGQSYWRSAISADGSVVAFTSTATDLVSSADPTGDQPDLYLWRKSTGAVRRLTSSTPAPKLLAMTEDGQRIAFGLYDSGASRWHLWQLDTMSLASTEIAIPSTLEPDGKASYSADGSKLLYSAKPTGSNYVPFIHVRDLITNTDTDLRKQTDGTLELGDNGNAVVYGTYRGIFYEGTAIQRLDGGTGDVLNGGSGVFFADVPKTGKCIVVESWEPSKLTSDLSNRGEVYYFSDVFTYNMGTRTYGRITNSFSAGVDRGVASTDCRVVAVEASAAALDPTKPGERDPTDVYVTRP